MFHFEASSPPMAAHETHSTRGRAGVLALLVATLLLASCVNRVGGTPPFELEVGDCFDDLWLAQGEESRVLRVEILPCEKPHQKEVTALVPVEGDERPGADVFAGLIETECDQALSDYAADLDGLEATGRFPSSNSWELGFRWIICFAEATDDSLLERSVADAPAPVDGQADR